MAQAKRGSGKKGGGASRGGSGNNGGGRKPAPGWLWLVTGLTVGLFVAFLVFLSQHEPRGRKPVEAEAEPVKEQAPAPSQAKVEPAKPEAAKAPEKKPLNYDFYTKLQEFEVEVPEDRKGTKPKPVASPGSYVLQVGSFKSAKEAESRKAELALLGIRSSVQTVKVEGNATYHRVRIGPYRDLDKVNKMRQTLRENHIDYVTLKERS